MWKSDLDKLDKNSAELRDSFALVEWMDKTFRLDTPTPEQLATESGRLHIAGQAAIRDLINVLKSKLTRLHEKAP